ncbi:MAG: NDP-sugar synthase [Actinomycetota bacterium]|nr:NDP-sugar synthase [Actinomycetota bacterium]
MKAMVLAAGKGTRLFPLTGEQPKPLAPVVNVPIIEHIFHLLANHGISEVYVNVYYLADALLEAYEEETHVSGMTVRLSREEELMGTAGGVKRLSENFDETFVVVMGDALTDANLSEIVAFHKEKGASATIALKRVYDTSEYGVVEVDGEGNILAFQEKPKPEEAISTLANTGIYVFEPGVFDYIPENTFFDFAQDVFPKLLEAEEKFVGYEGNFYWSDIGTLEAYRQAHYDVVVGNVEVQVPGEQRDQNVWIGENAQIHPTAHLDGCIVIGRDAVIGKDVVLTGHVMVGNDCWVRPRTTIKRSILLPGGTVGDEAYLEDCIVGHGYDVRAGETIRGGALIRRRI